VSFIFVVREMVTNGYSGKAMPGEINACERKQRLTINIAQRGTIIILYCHNNQIRRKRQAQQ